MKYKLAAFLLLLSLFCNPFKAAGAAESSKMKSSEKSPESSPAVTVTPTPLPEITHSPNMSKIIAIHKPMPSPSWGKVVQYHREKAVAMPGKNPETLHEFLFQDGQGIIRTAIFHENASGDGYWEVWVWDLP